MYTRRDLLRLTGSAMVGAAVSPAALVNGRQPGTGRGFVSGQPEAACENGATRSRRPRSRRRMASASTRRQVRAAARCA